MLVNSLRDQLTQMLSDTLAMSIKVTGFGHTDYLSGFEKYEVHAVGEIDELTLPYSLTLVGSSYRQVSTTVQVASVLVQLNKTAIHFLVTVNTEGKVIVQVVTSKVELVKRAMNLEFKSTRVNTSAATPTETAVKLSHYTCKLDGDKFVPVEDEDILTYIGL